MEEKIKSINIRLIILVLFITNLAKGQDNYHIFSKNTMQGTLYGVKNEQTDTEVIPPIYLQVKKSSHGMFVVQKDSFLGVVDTLHKIIIPFEYNYISEDRAFVSKNEKFALIDEKGKLLTQFIYDDFSDFNDGIAGIVINGKVGYINKNGKTILPAKFEKGEPCIGKFIVVYSKKWDSYGYDMVSYNWQGKEIQRQNIGSYGNYALVFNTEGKLIYQGESDETITVLPTKNTFLARYFGSGDIRYTIVNNNGQILNQFYGNASIEKNWIEISFYDGSVSRHGIVDFNGKSILPVNFRSISEYKFDNNTLAKVEFFDGQYFFINDKGECVGFDNQICPE